VRNPPPASGRDAILRGPISGDSTIATMKLRTAPINPYARKVRIALAEKIE
jgi:hypothetical protein